MITIFFHMTVKPERQADVEMLAKDMMATTRTEDGCIAYTIYRRTDQPRDFVLLEQ
jgi:quinol monooxygenase YgiN